MKALLTTVFILVTFCSLNVHASRINQDETFNQVRIQLWYVGVKKKFKRKRVKVALSKGKKKVTLNQLRALRNLNYLIAKYKWDK